MQARCARCPAVQDPRPAARRPGRTAEHSQPQRCQPGDRDDAGLRPQLPGGSVLSFLCSFERCEASLQSVVLCLCSLRAEQVGWRALHTAIYTFAFALAAV